MENPRDSSGSQFDNNSDNSFRCGNINDLSEFGGSHSANTPSNGGDRVFQIVQPEKGLHNMTLRDRSNKRKLFEDEQHNYSGLSNKQAARVVATRKSKTSSLKSKDGVLKPAKVKKGKFADGNAVIIEEIQSDTLNKSSVQKQISKNNLHPQWEYSTNLLHIPWDQLGATGGLGRPISYFPRDMVPLVRQVWIKVADPTNDTNIKKAFLLSVVTGLNLGIGSRRGNLRKVLIEINNDDWSNQTVENFDGRKNFKPPKKKGPKGPAKSAEELRLHVRNAQVIKLAKAREFGKAFKVLTKTKKSIPPSLNVYEQLKLK